MLSSAQSCAWKHGGDAIGGCQRELYISDFLTAMMNRHFYTDGMDRLLGNKRCGDLFIAHSRA
jgi:hypothetical protein